MQAKVRFDRVGPYLRSGGLLYRPMAQSHRLVTLFKDGEFVNVDRQRDSLQAIVTGSSGHVEHWLSQGPYLQANDQGELQFIPTETLAHRIGITEE